MAIELLQNQIGVLTAVAAISAYRFVKKSTTAFNVDQADAGSAPIGISQQASLITAPVIFTMGGISKLTAGAAVAVGDALMPDATGRGITATGDSPIGAIALEAAANANEIITVLVLPGFNAAALTNAVSGVAAGYKVARGVHIQVAAADTVATGLTTVVAVVASFRDAPSVKQLFVEASEGDQAGAPVAGSIVISTFKPTAVNDVTPVAASDFTENKKIGWVAVGT